MKVCRKHFAESESEGKRVHKGKEKSSECRTGSYPNDPNI